MKTLSSPLRDVIGYLTKQKRVGLQLNLRKRARKRSNKSTRSADYYTWPLAVTLLPKNVIVISLCFSRGSLDTSQTERKINYYTYTVLFARSLCTCVFIYLCVILSSALIDRLVGVESWTFSLRSIKLKTFWLFLWRVCFHFASANQIPPCTRRRWFQPANIGKKLDRTSNPAIYSFLVLKTRFAGEKICVLWQWFVFESYAMGMRGTTYGWECIFSSYEYNKYVWERSLMRGYKRCSTYL